MSASGSVARVVAGAVGALGVSALTYAAYAGLSWYRYGRPALSTGDDVDPLLDSFMPEYEVVERHRVRVAAPGEVTLSAAAETDLEESAVVRAIFKTREVVLGAHPNVTVRPRGLLAQMQSLGWGILAEVPGREIVVGAVTQPWLADVEFRRLAPAAFKGFREPGFVKIVWTLRADPLGPAESVFRTETRVATTDPVARRRFRWYWARFSPGIVLIRRVTLGLLKAEAERRSRAVT